MEDRLKEHNLKTKESRPLKQEGLSRISALMTDTALYERYAIMDGDVAASFCAASNQAYDFLLKLKGEGGVKITLCLSTTHNYYSFIYADYGCIFYLANTCFNSNAYLSLSELLKAIKGDK